MLLPEGQAYCFTTFFICFVSHSLGKKNCLVKLITITKEIKRLGETFDNPENM